MRIQWISTLLAGFKQSFVNCWRNSKRHWHIQLFRPFSRSRLTRPDFRPLSASAWLDNNSNQWTKKLPPTRLASFLLIKTKSNSNKRALFLSHLHSHTSLFFFSLFSLFDFAYLHSIDDSNKMQISKPTHTVRVFSICIKSIQPPTEEEQTTVRNWAAWNDLQVTRPQEGQTCCNS